MTMNSPNLLQPNFSNFKHVTRGLIALVLEYANVNFEVLQACTNKNQLAWHFKATLQQVRGITPTSSYCTFDNPTSPDEY